MSCEPSYEKGLDAIAGRGHKVGVGPLTTVVHAGATDWMRKEREPPYPLVLLTNHLCFFEWHN